MRSILEILSGLWEKRTIVKNVCNVAIKIIDSLDGKIDWEKKEKQ